MKCQANDKINNLQVTKEKRNSWMSVVFGSKADAPEQRVWNSQTILGCFCLSFSFKKHWKMTLFWATRSIFTYTSSIFYSFSWEGEIEILLVFFCIIFLCPGCMFCNKVNLYSQQAQKETFEQYLPEINATFLFHLDLTTKSKNEDWDSLGTKNMLKRDFSHKRKTFIEVFCASLKMENVRVSIFLYFFFFIN